ncbi:MAG: hypothetical protein V1913_13120 [Fibrobacterota bacterium]
MSNSNLDRLEKVAKALGHYKDKVVFVGGAVCSLYFHDPGAPGFRATLDVDLTIDITTRTEWYAFEEIISRMGFKHDIGEEAPICRKILEGVKVDIMPTEESVINLKSTWFKAGFHRAITKVLPGGTTIQILSLPYFIASKFEAFFERKLNEKKKPDYWASRDLEDIINVLAYIKDGSELLSGSGILKKSLLQYSETVLGESRIKEIIHGHLNSKEPLSVSEKVFNHLLLLSALS